MYKYLMLLPLTTAMLSGCIPSERLQSLRPKGQYDIGRPTVMEELRTLPEPNRRIAVAVYRFPDKTGAFKPNEEFAVYSSAVPKGAESIVLDALTTAGNGSWFRVLEREGLESLIRERSILEVAYDGWKRERQLASAIEGKLAEKKKDEVPLLSPEPQQERQGIEVNPNNRFATQGVPPQGAPGGPPRITVNNSALPYLSAAEFLAEGAIIGYDSDVASGGAGARFLNIGGFGEVRKDLVTVSLRIISVKTGDVVASSTMTKGILSQKLQGSGFGYVSLDRMLEAEIGVGQNEPVYEALNLAIQAAVVDVVHKGAERGIWSYRHPPVSKAPEGSGKKESPAAPDDFRPSRPPMSTKLPPASSGISVEERSGRAAPDMSQPPPMSTRLPPAPPKRAHAPADTEKTSKKPSSRRP
jgi:curli production assembly/transport component CsgG